MIRGSVYPEFGRFSYSWAEMWSNLGDRTQGPAYCFIHPLIHRWHGRSTYTITSIAAATSRK